MKNILILLVILTLGSACSSIRKAQIASPLDVAVSSRMNAEIDVDLSNELVGYAYAGFLFHLFKVSGDSKYADGIDYGSRIGNDWGNTDKVKAAAAYNALKNSKADVLIAPRYVIEENSNPFYQEVKVKVIAYAGKIREIRNVQQNINRLELDKVKLDD